MHIHIAILNPAKIKYFNTSTGSAYAKYHDSHACYPRYNYYNSLLLIKYELGITYSLIFKELLFYFRTYNSFGLLVLRLILVLFLSIIIIFLVYDQMGNEEETSYELTITMPLGFYERGFVSLSCATYPFSFECLRYNGDKISSMYLDLLVINKFFKQCFKARKKVSMCLKICSK